MVAVRRDELIQHISFVRSMNFNAVYPIYFAEIRCLGKPVDYFLYALTSHISCFPLGRPTIRQSCVCGSHHYICVFCYCLILTVFIVESRRHNVRLARSEAKLLDCLRTIGVYRVHKVRYMAKQVRMIV